MLKEEKELRKSVRAYLTNYDRTDTPCINYAGEGELRKLITALIRAVREDCAKVIKAECNAYFVSERDCDIVCAAIRGRK